MVYRKSSEILFGKIYSGMNLIHNTAVIEETDETTDVIDDIMNACKVVLFNDEWHTFDEVISQIMKAIACDYHKAESMAYEVHERGKAIVYSGSLQECLKVSGILEEIALHTQIEM
ncbi:MAG: ATP-dependent Clp protease adaptor ClpS [Candidatus Kapabacteria bacterium]|jgi:ATP-dependent Clp protease adapter protein ClpS|nr:ATP-dependent Clp protease adaptor ClpS [Candidatus Kapabacteria bacterium]